MAAGTAARKSGGRVKNGRDGRTSEASLGRVLDFMRILWEVDHALQRVSKRMRSTLGVTGPQRLVVRIVGRVPSISAGQLARILHLHPSTLTGVLDRLERQRLIARRSDPGDARRFLFELTKRGRRIDASAHRGTVEAAVRTTVRGVSPSDLEAVRGLLRRLKRALERGAARRG